MEDYVVSEELYKKFFPGLCWLSQETGYPIPLILVALGNMERGVSEANKKSLAASYSAISTKFEEYRKRVIENIGKEKEAQLFKRLRD